jgi:hypothetical protein
MHFRLQKLIVNFYKIDLNFMYIFQIIFKSKLS